MSFVNVNNQLIIARAMDPNAISCMDAAIGVDNSNFKTEIINAIAGANASLPENPGFELHPYKGLLAYTNQSKIIIGTFPPISYLIDTITQQNPGVLLQTLSQPTHPTQVITKPQIPFFHGNISALWAVLLTPLEITQLNVQLGINRTAAKTYLIQFLNRQGIYYDDIILSTQRKLGKLNPNENLGYTYEDVNLKNICIDETLILKLIISNTENKIICFTNGATFRTNGLKLFTRKAMAGLVNTAKSDAFSLFLRGCQGLGLHIEMQCLPHYAWTSLSNLTQAQRSTKLIFQLRLSKGRKCVHADLNNFTGTEFTVIAPFSPAAHGTIEHHPIVVGYRAVNGPVPAVNILKHIYNKFRNNQHDLLYPYNI